MRDYSLISSLQMIKTAEKAYATEFIDAFIKRHSDRIGCFKKLVSYIAERPSVERIGRQGLFSQTDDKIDLDAVLIIRRSF